MSEYGNSGSSSQYGNSPAANQPGPSNKLQQALENALASKPLANELVQVSYNNVQVLKASWSVAQNGGAVGTLNLGALLPANAIVVRSFLDVKTSLAGSGASIAISCTGSDDILGVTSESGLTMGQHDAIQTGAASVMVKNGSSASPVLLAISGAPLTAGSMNIFLEYIVSQ